MKKLFIFSAAFMVCLTGAEMLARFGLGLGSPPLYVEDPVVEYMLKPSQDLLRFGNRQIINQSGMRSSLIPDLKPEGEFRILAIGDSVLNGGSLTDHSDLATSLLSDDKLRVLNASAGSWGPENMLAYIEKYGVFDADLIVVVVSSHDARDVPTFAPLNSSTHPTTRPFSALTEGFFKYLPRFAPSFLRRPANDEQNQHTDFIDAEQSALTAVSMLAAQQVPTCFILHPTQSEFLSMTWSAGHSDIVAAAANSKIVDGMNFIQNSNDYRDSIHLSVVGQKRLADAITSCID